jgi:hypothetical protein
MAQARHGERAAAEPENLSNGRYTSEPSTPPSPRGAAAATATAIGLARFPPGTADPRTSSRNPIHTASFK